MGLPEIIIDFKTKASTAIKRSSRGVVAMILNDSTDTTTTRYTYKSLAKVDNNKFNEDNNGYISQVFKSDVNKLIIERITEENTLEKALNNLSKESFNYVCYPASELQENEKIASFIREQRKKNKIFKAVLSNTEGDHEGIINYVSTCVSNDGITYTPDKFVSRIAGILASISLDISSTYYKLNDIYDVVSDQNLDNQVDDGKLVLLKDDGIVKIGRGVNSLTTHSITKGDEFKKIRIIEIIDMVKDDIYKTIKGNYVGKVPNTYDNKMLCISTINSYLRDLVKEEVLDPDSDNKVDIDLDSHKAYIMQREGKTEEEVNAMDEQKIRKYNTGTNLFLTGQIKPVDCIEDIKIVFNI